MIKYKLEEKGGLSVLTVTGHAKHNGNEFNAVCGMVSVLTQACLYGCGAYGGGAKYVKTEKGDLQFACNKNSVTDALLGSCIRGLEAIHEDFPDEVEECKTYI